MSLVLNQPPTHQMQHVPVHRWTCLTESSSHTLPYRIVQVSIQVLPLFECLTEENPNQNALARSKENHVSKTSQQQTRANFKNLEKLPAKEIAAPWLIPVTVCVMSPIISPGMRTALTKERVWCGWPCWAFLLTGFIRRDNVHKTRTSFTKNNEQRPCTTKFQAETLQTDKKRV